jgi:hypothetical protein
MNNDNVTIRHARTAIHMVMSGAVRIIESQYGDDAEQRDACHDSLSTLFDQCADEISDWKIPGHDYNRRNMVDEMQVMLNDPNCPDVVRELLTRNNCNP